MIITTVHYQACINTGNYENEKIELVARLEEGDTPEVVVPALREKVFTMAHKREVYEERLAAKNELRELREKTQEAQRVWEQTATFLQAQGLRTDPPRIPQFINLLEAGPEEQDVTESVEVEVVGDDEQQSSGSYGPGRYNRIRY